LASGNTWGTCSERSGLSYIQASIIAQWDRQGFGKLLKLAEECQKRAFVVQMRGALHHRAVEGVRSARIGRIGKDQDGILRDDQGKIIEEVKYSDKLLEFGLSKLDKPTFGEQGANVHIGAQVIYNISGLGVAPKPAIDAEIVDAKPEAGENPATIDMRSLEDVD
jgi:hypothetical protein